MSKLKIERNEEAYTKLERILGIPGPSRGRIRKHGVFLFLAGLTLTTLLVMVSRTTFFGYYCSRVLPNAVEACLQRSSIVSVAACFTAFATVSILGIGLVEMLTASPWNKAQGPKPLAILIATWILFVSVLCLLINQAFGV
jgi:hypothetical protein